MVVRIFRISVTVSPVSASRAQSWHPFHAGGEWYRGTDREATAQVREGLALNRRRRTWRKHGEDNRHHKQR